MTNKSSYVKVGDSAPNFCLPSVNGEDVQLSDYSGNKIAMFFWASWWACRTQLPVWQEVSEDSSIDIEVITVAMDVQGFEKPKLYLEKAQSNLATIIDKSNQLGKL